MASVPNELPVLNSSSANNDSRQILLNEASNELIFAVVGHAGSGTSMIAQQLKSLLTEKEVKGLKFDVEILKAREVIVSWAVKNKKALPSSSPTPSIQNVEMLQNYGDQMRAEKTRNGEEDHAAIARALILKIRQLRAEKTASPVEAGKPVTPDGKPRAYILDSLRHPAEVRLLRHVYGNAFVLLGVVCEEEKRISRIGGKYRDGGRALAIEFMKRDADAAERHGQHVADAFHLADFFVDNTVDRTKRDEGNPDWTVVENLSRLVKIVTHSELIRPTVAETAMHHAYAAQMQSACLSRQVGAAVVDINGNVVATGTNEVPKAGGGVYGETFETEEHDARCAMMADAGERYCRNTREQNVIILDLLQSFQELLKDVKEIRELTKMRKDSLAVELRKTRIGGLLEFSRAVHAEMDALLSAARKGVSLVGTRLFVTTFPCHYCARHIVAAGVDEVQYIEPYPKSQALNLHKDAIAVEYSGWQPPSQNRSRPPSERSQATKVLFRPFSGIAPQLYKSAFMKDRELKNKTTGNMLIHEPSWGTPWHLPKVSYVEVEAILSQEIIENA